MTENEFNSGIEKVDGMNGWFGGERWDYGIAFKDQNPSLSVALGDRVYPSEENGGTDAPDSFVCANVQTSLRRRCIKIESLAGEF